MKLVFVLILAVLSVTAQAEVLSFKNWKMARTDIARQNLDRYQAESSKNPQRATAQQQRPPHAEARLQQAKQSLEIAQELNAHDYFVLYLSQLKSEADFQEGAKKLAPEEVAEILTSVRKQNRLSDNGMETSLPMITPGGNSAAMAQIRR